MGSAACQANYATHGSCHDRPRRLPDELTTRSSEAAKPNRSSQHTMLGDLLASREFEVRRASRTDEWEARSSHHAVRMH